MKTKSSAIQTIKISESQFILQLHGDYHEDICVCITKILFGKNKEYWIGICSNGTSLTPLKDVEDAKTLATMYLIDQVI